MTRILRADDSRPRLPNPEATRVLRAGQLQNLAEAEQVLARARTEAGAIMERARSEATHIRQDAAEEGRAQAAAILAAAGRRSFERLEQAETELTLLAVRIAEKLVGEQLRIHPETVTQIVTQCLRTCTSAQRIVMHLNPDDLPLVERELPTLRALVETELLVPQADPFISRGGCLLETELGQIDGRLETQLQALQEALLR
jgi:type III secretion system HrpE/YscL family protein